MRIIRNRDKDIINLLFGKNADINLGIWDDISLSMIISSDIIPSRIAHLLPNLQLILGYRAHDDIHIDRFYRL